MKLNLSISSIFIFGNNKTSAVARAECLGPHPIWFHFGTAEGIITCWLASCSNAETIPECAFSPDIFPATHYSILNRTKLVSWIFYAPFYINDDGVPDLLKSSTDFSPSFWKVNSMRNLRVVHIWTARNIFQNVVGVRESFWFFKQNLMQIVFSLDIPLRWFSHSYNVFKTSTLIGYISCTKIQRFLQGLAPL